MRRPRISEGRLQTRLREEQRRASGTERQEEEAGKQAALHCPPCYVAALTAAVSVVGLLARPQCALGRPTQDQLLVVQRVVAQPRRSKFTVRTLASER